jgi:predicted phage gp36 major capsid-like protein
MLNYAHSPELLTFLDESGVTTSMTRLTREAPEADASMRQRLAAMESHDHPRRHESERDGRDDNDRRAHRHDIFLAHVEHLLCARY